MSDPTCTRKPGRGWGGWGGHQQTSTAKDCSNTWARKSLWLRMVCWNLLTSSACTCWTTSRAPEFSRRCPSRSGGGWPSGWAAGSPGQLLERCGVCLAFSLGPKQGCRRLMFSLFCWIPPGLEDGMSNLEKHSQGQLFSYCVSFPFIWVRNKISVRKVNKIFKILLSDINHL